MMLRMTRLRISAALVLLTASFACAFVASAQKLTLPLWPTGAPEASQTTGAELNTPKKSPKEPGVTLSSITNVSTPTITVFPAPQSGAELHAAAVVFPGGGYQQLAYTLEGEEPCAWFNSIGITCVLAKYRVPWNGRYPEMFGALEDAQQAVRLTRAHAAEWHIDPRRVGIMGFSAGGHLSVALSQHHDDAHVLSTPAASEVDASISARPDFVILGYPAYLNVEPSKSALAPNAKTPPTFIIQAENDKIAVDSAITYYIEMKDAGVPAEMHLFDSGGHGFGMHPQGAPELTWSALAATWLREIKMIP